MAGEQDDAKRQQKELEQQGWVFGKSSAECADNCPQCKRGTH